MEFDENIFLSLSIGYSISLLFIVIFSYYINYCLFDKVIEFTKSNIIDKIKNCEIVIQEYEENNDNTDDDNTDDSNCKCSDDDTINPVSNMDIEDYDYDNECVDKDNITDNKFDDEIKDYIDDDKEIILNSEDLVNILRNLLSTISKNIDNNKDTKEDTDNTNNNTTDNTTDS